MKKTIILTGIEILSQITDAGRGKVFDYDAESKMAGEKYKRLAYNGTAFIAEPKLADDILGGKISQLTLIQSQREKLDENGNPMLGENDEKIMVESLQLAGTMSWDAQRTFVENNAVLEVAADVAKAKILKGAGIDFQAFFSKPNESAASSQQTAAADAGEAKLHNKAGESALG